MSEQRLIDANELVANLDLLARHEDDFRANAIRGIIHTVNHTPTIEAATVVHGHWTLLDTSDENGSLLECSNCRDCRMFYYTDAMGTAYCPTCGAKMDEVEE